MEQRNLDFETEISREQWEMLGRTAARESNGEGAFGWDPENGEEIRVRVRDRDAPTLWSDFVGDDEHYGATAREVATFHFNGGRPFASVDVPYVVDEPVYTEQEVDAMNRELESWVRGRWHTLMRDSGLHYDRGHLPQDVGDRTGLWRRLEADGCTWEVRAIASDDGVDGDMIEFHCLDDDRPSRRVSVDAGELDRANGPRLINLFRRALPGGGDRQGEAGRGV